MLPSNLLVTKTWRGRVEPLLLKSEGLPLALASEVLDLLKRGVGKGDRELGAEMVEVEEMALELGFDLRVARAMFTLACRAAKFEPLKSPVDPVRARLEVFERACKEFGFTLFEGERAAVLQQVAAQLGCSVGDLELVLSKHLEEVLVEPPALGAEELVRRLNLSMVQTLLFKATQLDVVFRGSGLTAKRLLRAVKALGLLYMAECYNEEVRLTIDGPASLLRQTRRYGTRIAKLIPHVMLAERWRIHAKILGRRRELAFELSDRSSRLFPRVEEESEPLFDSEVEREFYKSLSRLAPTWRVEREPEPLVAGTKVLIPDFSVSDSERKVYIEVLGFWTKDYLERKLQKLREIRGVDIIVTVNEELACSSVKGLPQEVVVFRRRLRGSDVYSLLRKRFGKPQRAEGAFEGKLEGKLEEFAKKLPDLSGKTLSEAFKELEKLGVAAGEAARVLEMLGYRLEWDVLDPNRIKLKRALHSSA